MKVLKVFIILCLISCGQTTEEEVDDAIYEANLLLSSRQCDAALEILNAVGMQNKNKDYLDSLATAYACKGNYSTTTLFTSDLANLGSSPAQNTVLGFLTTFSTSGDMTSPTNTNFINLKTAIDTLLYAGGNSSASSANRLAVFSASEATDLNLQSFFMILVNFGRWLQYYGNTGTTGVKGSGSEPNTCIATYTDANAIAALSLGATGSCTNGANTGHVDIEGASRAERLCQGITLFNNFRDTIGNLTFEGANADVLTAVKGIFSGLCTSLADPTVAGSYDVSMCDVRDQAVCETQTNTNIERFSVGLLELLLQ